MEQTTKAVGPQDLVDVIVANAQAIFGLKFRWLDEREYEDFAEYRRVLQTILGDEWPLLSLTKTFTGRVKHACGKTFKFSLAASGRITVLEER